MKNERALGQNVAYLEAYALETGGFRGIARNTLTGELMVGKLRSTLDEARLEAMAFGKLILAGRDATAVPSRKSKGHWRLNYRLTDPAPVAQAVIA